MIGGELVGGGLEHDAALFTRGLVPGQSRQGRQPRPTQGQGASPGQGPVIGRGTLDQPQQLPPRLIQQMRIASGHPGLERQGGAVHADVVGVAGAGPLHLVDGGVQQGGGLHQGGRVAVEPGQS